MLGMAERVERILPVALSGAVARTAGLTVSVNGFPAPLGAVCEIETDDGGRVEAEVAGFDHAETILVPFSQLSGIRRGCPVRMVQSVPVIAVGDGLLGRVVDGRGRVCDGRPHPVLPHRVGLHPDAISPLDRRAIETPLGTGVRAIDGLLTCGCGQRLGIFAGSGVGKSTLLGQMARGSEADVIVVALIGERGREVREFIDRDLGPTGLRKSVVVAATGDEPPLMRVRAALVSAALAEYFRNRGRNVLLLMDSVTRVALAQREIGLAAGEPPATRGYPPSVFSLLPRLLERSGRTHQGSITGLYTVLVEGDDLNEPVTDAVRGTVDGHVVLSRELAERGQWPAIDVPASVSRTMTELVAGDQHRLSHEVRELVATARRTADLVAVGAYVAGASPERDRALAAQPIIEEFLRQTPREISTWSDSLQAVGQLQQRLAALREGPPAAVPLPAGAQRDSPPDRTTNPRRTTTDS